MNQLSTSQTSILSNPLVTSNHGKKIYPIAMDVVDDGLRIPDRIQDKDIMDTSLDKPQDPSSNGPDPEATAKSRVATGAEPTPVPENTTESDDGAPQSSKQLRKTPH